MATLQMDLPTAQRFVSSLSKSLQALCHGCMDFDTEIEIVGFINVNIDSSNKVDYVLSEKVSKGTNNSMQFTSNSFLAKKDEPKVSKDRSCSPIPELNKKNLPSARGRSSGLDSQMYRSSGIFSPHSQVLRGSHKRAWSGGDWRTSPRKYSRGAASARSYGNQTHMESQHSAFSDSMASQSQSYSESQSDSHSLPSVSQQDFNTSETTPSQMQIKTENTNDNISDQQTSSLPSDIKVKPDPDSLESQEVAASDQKANVPNDSSGEPVPGGSGQDTFFKLEQGETEANGDPSSSANYAGDANADPEQQMQEPGGEGPSEFSESFFTGEESGDGSQFDVIEIEDEDEDIADFTDHDFNRDPHTSKKQKPKRPCLFCKDYVSQLPRHLERKHGNEEPVKEALRFPRREKTEAFAVIRRDGILQENIRLKKAGLPLLREREQGVEMKRVSMCCGCKAFISSRRMSRHKKKCSASIGLKTRSIDERFLGREKDMDDFTTNVLMKINKDAIGKLVTEDKTIAEFGRQLWGRNIRKDAKVVKSEMRIFGKLVLEMRDIGEDPGLEGKDVVKKENFNILTDAIQNMTKRTETCDLKAGLKLSIGYLLKKVIKLMKGLCIQSGDDDGLRECEKFSALLDLRWDSIFSNTSV